MARILFNTTLGASAWAGSEVLWFQTAAYLVAAGHQVAAVLPPSMGIPANTKRLADAAIQTLSTPFHRVRFLATRVSRRWRPSLSTPGAAVVKAAIKWRADMVVLSQASCWGAYSEMLALAEAGIPYVCISQLNTPFSWPGDGLFGAVGAAFSKARAAVFVSQGNLDLFQSQAAVELGNAHVIYNPPSFDVSDPCGPPPVGPFRLLNVARIDPGHKGQDLLIDVLNLPKWREREVQLSVAGGGNRKWLEQLVKSKGLGNVTLLGHVGDLRSVWQEATFGVFPSRYEGMPLAMIEGMALGRAIVATDVAGHGEWIEHGRNGFLAAGCTSSSLDAALEMAWRQRGDAARLGEAARQTFERIMHQDPGAELAGLVSSFLGKS
jgi:glycosyltransferase involved in cell wall biosynthesis